MLQPCPAPVIPTIGIASAGAGVFGAGAGLGAWAAGHGMALQKPPVVVAPASSDLTSRQDLTHFEQCSYDGLHTAQSLEFPANGSISSNM